MNSRPLRVLMATARFLPLMGGTESHVYEVSRRLVRAGVEVTVLTTDPTGKLPALDKTDGVRIQRVRAYPAQKDYYFAPGVYNTIVNGKWDLVHCQGIHTFVPPFAMLAARRAHIPYVVTFHTGGHSSRRRAGIRNLQWRALRPLLSHATRLIGVSEFEARLFQEQLRLPAERFSVIPNGGHLPSPSGLQELKTGKLIVSVGRLERYKGHDRAIRALPHLLESNPDTRLLIVGAGPFERELRQIAKESGVEGCVEIRAIPAAERGRMAAVLSSADLVVLFSEYEAHPVAVMEALALKRPVLVTDTSGLRELAERRLVRSIPLESTPEEIAAGIRAQLADPLIAGDVELPTWNDCAKQVQSVYESVCEETQCAS